MEHGYFCFALEKRGIGLPKRDGEAIGWTRVLMSGAAIAGVIQKIASQPTGCLYHHHPRSNHEREGTEAGGKRSNPRC